MDSIEHNPEWFNRVNLWLYEKNLNNVNYQIFDVNDDKFKGYTRAISTYDDKIFDIVAVDGRERVKCVNQAINKVKVGGYLILDDSHRQRYSPAFDLIKNYNYKRYDFGLLQTTIFQREK